MDRRRFAYIGVGLAVLLAGRLLRSPPPAPPSDSTHPELAEAAEAAASATAPLVRLREPPSASVEVGILTERSEAELANVIDRDSVAALIGPDLCGDPAACDAVRRTLKDEHATTLRIAAASEWATERADFDASAAKLAEVDRASLTKRTTAVIVRVAANASPQELPIRTTFAAAAAIAAKIGGLVYDPVLGRVESARAFAKHAVTASLDGSAFRLDRIELLYEPKGEGVVRLLTAGLERFGAPDVEAANAPVAASRRVTEVVVGVAAAIANGARVGPIVLSAADLARASGAEPEDAGVEIAVDVASVHPEAGDPNDFIVRIVPPEGDGPMGYLDLAERFFGSVLDVAPDDAVLRTQHDRAQHELGPALARWRATRGARLLARLPFAIAGDAGIESMWVEVTGYGARSVTGVLIDDPVAATDVERGDRVTRPRSDVEDLRSR